MTDLNRSRRWHLLPLALLATMLGIALGIEAIRFDTLFWPPKLPLAVLLGWVLLKPRRAGV